MRIMIVTDAWSPQVNGVVHTLKNVVKNLKKEHEVFVLHPHVEGAITLFQFYYDIPFVQNSFQLVERYYDEFKPDRVHIATEGSLGIAMRAFVSYHNIEFNTSYHTKLDDYGWIHYRIPKNVTKQYLKWFHRRSRRVLVPTKSVADELCFENSVIWGRGVDTELFNFEGGGQKNSQKNSKSLISVGRVSKDKNLDDFCQIEGFNKILVGDGPYLDELKSRFKDVTFTGRVAHADLKDWYHKAAVFVFPSKSDTFGLVILEAMACGLPVVAYDVPGPRDVVQDRVTGFIGESLTENVHKAFENQNTLSENAVRYAQAQSWENVSTRFIELLQ